MFGCVFFVIYVFDGQFLLCFCVFFVFLNEELTLADQRLVARSNGIWTGPVPRDHRPDPPGRTRLRR